jgi:fructuronate reductase
LRRFSNPRAGDLLARIAADGSTKLVVRTVPTIRAERAAGRVPLGCATTVAAWVLHLRGLGAPITDAGAAAARVAANSGGLPEAVPAVLDTLESGLGADQDFVDAVLRQADAIASQ